MRIICYRKSLDTARETPILDRAAHKKHMLKKLLLWDILLFAVLSILGGLLHYASPLFTVVPVLQFITPVNESIWEHLKLLFYPTVLVGIARKLATGKLQHGILTTFAEGLLLTILFMVTAFYTYSGILGSNAMHLDIALFYLCCLILTVYIHIRSYRQKKSSLPGLLIMLLLAGCFIYFTLYPPNIGLFQSFSQQLQ